MLRFDAYADIPGLQAVAETYESEFRWGATGLGILAIGYINPNTVDSGNTPTYELRPGLLLGRQFATNQFTNYTPGATDGSEVATAILITALRMQDFQGVNQPKFYGVLVGGPVQASKILGLDGQARGQMSAHFQFDDDYPGAFYVPWKRQITKTAAYTILPSDNGTIFDNTGAGGSVAITLPPIANGYVFGFRVIAAQTIVITSAEGGNIVLDNNASGNTATIAGRIGSGAVVYSNPGGTKWLVANYGSQGGANQLIT